MYSSTYEYDEACPYTGCSNSNSLKAEKHFYIPPKLKVKKLKSLLVSGDLMYLYNIYTYICNTYVYICKMTNKASAYMRDDEYF